MFALLVVTGVGVDGGSQGSLESERRCGSLSLRSQDGRAEYEKCVSEKEGALICLLGSDCLRFPGQTF